MYKRWLNLKFKKRPSKFQKEMLCPIDKGNIPITGANKYAWFNSLRIGNHYDHHVFIDVTWTSQHRIEYHVLQSN